MNDRAQINTPTVVLLLGLAVIAVLAFIFVLKTIPTFVWVAAAFLIGVVVLTRYGIVSRKTLRSPRGLIGVGIAGLVAVFLLVPLSDGEPVAKVPHPSTWFKPAEKQKQDVLVSATMVFNRGHLVDHKASFNGESVQWTRAGITLEFIPLCWWKSPDIFAQVTLVSESDPSFVRSSSVKLGEFCATSAFQQSFTKDFTVRLSGIPPGQYTVHYVASYSKADQSIVIGTQKGGSYNIVDKQTV